MFLSGICLVLSVFAEMAKEQTNRKNKGREKIRSSKPLKWFSFGNCSDRWAETPVARLHCSVVAASLHIQWTAQHFFQGPQFCLLSLSGPEMLHLYLCHWYLSGTSHCPEILQTMTLLLKPLDTQREKVLCRSCALFKLTGKSCPSLTCVLWFLLWKWWSVSSLCCKEISWWTPEERGRSTGI